jgi:hypothetical protein
LAGLIAGLLLSNVSSAAVTSYGEDRAQIEDLQARYLFALDFHDPQLDASTFSCRTLPDHQHRAEDHGKQKRRADPSGSTSGTTIRSGRMRLAASATVRTNSSK